MMRQSEVRHIRGPLGSGFANLAEQGRAQPQAKERLAAEREEWEDDNEAANQEGAAQSDRVDERSERANPSEVQEKGFLQPRIREGRGGPGQAERKIEQEEGLVEPRELNNHGSPLSSASAAAARRSNSGSR